MDSGFEKGMREESLLRILSENYEALYYVDFDQNTITPYRMNKVIEENFGDYFRTKPSFEEAMKGYIQAIVAPEDQEEMLKRADPSFLRDRMKNRRTYSYDFRVYREGSLKYFRFKISNLEGVGELHQAAVGFADISMEIDRINQLIESQAMLSILEKDKLTGLYSKEFFFKKVEQYMEEHPDNQVMMWTTDVQGLKLINEKYGMAVGDEVLRIMANNGKYAPGYLFGGRIEGDKFAALMEDGNPDCNMVQMLLQEDCMEEFPVPNVVFKHGVYHIRKRTTLSVQGMYDRTLLALNSIKNEFGSLVAEYNDKLKEDLMVHRQIEADAKRALKEKEFQVFFQPKIDVEGGRVYGAEALVRWLHPTLGFMNPGLFIPIFEQNGFITSLDFFVWEEVCRALVSFKEKGLPNIQVSVNASRRDFETPDFAQKIISLVDQYGIDHSQFQIEITESSYSDNMEQIKATVKILHDLGFSVALDDFGTGYSSMVALSSLDLDEMKLDMSIIKNDVPGTEKNILEFSMQLARMMHLKSVAEGVETEGQVERIRSLGGDYIQGFFYSKPIPQREFEEYVLRMQQNSMV